MTQPPGYTLETVTSRDGSTVTYRELGSGPGVILVHGGFQAAQSFMSLAAALGDAFTLHVINRRGRGGSAPLLPDHSLQTDREDIAAIVRKTGASRIFGLSSGAIITLEAARSLPELEKVAVYEPPLWTPQFAPTDWVGRYDREVAEGNLAAALATALKGTRVSPVVRRVPRFILVPLFRRMLERDRTHHPSGDVAIETVIPTMHFDMQLVKETRDAIPSMRSIGAEVLLMEGSRSPSFLRHSLDALEAVLSRARRITLPGLDHTAPSNGEQPARVAAVLRRFFV
jgi:pimeloyl-ACP methyl ester carboxylesterase